MALSQLIKSGQGARTVEAYYDDFISKIRLTDDMDERNKVDMFIEGLRGDIRQQVRLHQAGMGLNMALETVLNAAKQIEIVFKKRQPHSVNMIQHEGEGIAERPTGVLQPDLVLLGRTIATQDRMGNKIEALEVQISEFNRYNKSGGER